MHAAFAIFFAACIIQLFKGKVQNMAKIELFNTSLERYYPSTLTFRMYFAQIWRTSDENWPIVANKIVLILQKPLQ